MNDIINIILPIFWCYCEYDYLSIRPWGTAPANRESDTNGFDSCEKATIFEVNIEPVLSHTRRMVPASLEM